MPGTGMADQANDLGGAGVHEQHCADEKRVKRETKRQFIAQFRLFERGEFADSG